MAVEAAAALQQRIVFESHFFGLRTNIFVAFDAQRIAGLVEKKAVIRPVGIVAGLAVAFNDHLVRAARFIRDHILMAAAAQRFNIGYQQIFVVGRVGVVAGCAISLLKQRMDGAQFDRLGQVLVALQTFGALGSGLELHLMLWIRRSSENQDRDGAY